jgi:tetratricopeptide (TPR) repeat protein
MGLLLITLLSLLSASLESTTAALTFVPQSNSISGHVVDESRAGITDLQIELLNDVDSVLQRTKTDSSGFFVFQRLSTGIFQVRVQTYGTSYVGQTQRVQLEHTRRFEQMEFVLTVRKTTSTSTMVGAVFVQEVPELARKEYDRGAELLKNKKQKEAIEKLKSAIAMFPNYFDALELLGSEYVKAEAYEPAVPLLTKAIEINKRSYHSLYLLSVAQYNLNQRAEAIDSMRRAITLNQGSVNANLWLGTLLRQTSKFDEAEVYLKQADKLAASKSGDTHWQLALLFHQLKRYNEAADELELFLKVEPDARDIEGIKKLIKRFRKQAADGQ